MGHRTLRWVLWTFVQFWALSATAWAGIQLQSTGLRLAEANDQLNFRPMYRIRGHMWREAKPCFPRGQAQINCVAGPYGIVQVRRLDGNSVQMHFMASRDLVLHGLRLDGIGHVAGATSFLSNGVQSWSQSGILKLPRMPPLPGYAAQLNRLDQQEEHRDGRWFSWDTTAVFGEGQSVVLGTQAATRLRTWFQVHQSITGRLHLNVTAGGLRDSIWLRRGQRYRHDPLYMAITTKPTEALQAYGRRLPRLRAASGPTVGWNSWYQLFSHVRSEDVAANVAQLPEFLEQPFTDHGITYPQPVVYVDDGWSKAWGDWYPNEKFAEGLTGVRHSIQDQGYQPGLWIAPLLVAVDLPLYRDHPEWFLRQFTYEHPTGRYGILDITHPQAKAYVQETIRRLVGYGFRHLKIDFLIAGLYPGTRYETVTSLEAYHLALSAIREAAGAQVDLIACGAPGIASFPYVDGWRVGADITFENPSQWVGPSWVDVANQARNISARWFYCGDTRCDADPLLLRAEDPMQSRAAAWVVSSVGGGLFLSDDLDRLPKDRQPGVIDGVMLRQALAMKPMIPRLAGFQPASQLDTPNLLGRVFGNQYLAVPYAWDIPVGGTLWINFNRGALAIPGQVLGPKESVYRP